MQTRTTYPIATPASEPGQFATALAGILGLKQPERVIEMLNQTLSDALTLRDLYKKHHWQVSGPAFYQLHLLFDKHHEELTEIVDLVGDRVQALGGISVAMGADAAEMTRIPRPPRSREAPEAQIRRLLNAHEILIRAVREAASLAAEAGDDGTNDLLISELLRKNETQVWFLAEHLRNNPAFDDAEARKET
jgi:starvation-inducible DNA-binding protein